MSSTSLMTMQEMIELAFGEADKNTINFKLIQTILYLVARQLRLLDRKITLDVGYIPTSKSSLSVTEINIHGQVPKEKSKSKTKNKEESSDLYTETKSSRPHHETSELDARFSKEKPKPSKFESGKGSGITADKYSTSDNRFTGKKATGIPASKLSTETSSIFKEKIPEEFLEEKHDHKTDAQKQETTSKKRYESLLEEIEINREKVLRIIHQRADSKEEGVITPSPMVPLPSTELKREKLLIVERLPSEEVIPRTSQSDSTVKTRQLSIVTREEFEELMKSVIEIQNVMGPMGSAEFPENMALLQELRKGASLTDAMAALQLSARLEAIEKTIGKMMSLITDLVRENTEAPSIDQRSPTTVTKLQSEIIEDILKEDKTKPEEYKTEDTTCDIAADACKTKLSFHEPKSVPELSEVSKSVPAPASKEKTKKNKKDFINQNDGPTIEIRSALSTSRQVIGSISKSQKPDSADEDLVKISITMPEYTYRKPKNLFLDNITHEDLEEAFKDMYEKFYESLSAFSLKICSHVQKAIAYAKDSEEKYAQTLKFIDRLDEVEAAVVHYTKQVNAIDTELSAQISNYQEQLIQMQYELEIGLENMNEALSHTGTDTHAMLELNSHFKMISMDFDKAKEFQNNLSEVQDLMSVELNKLAKEIELLQATKSDRDEVVDALRDKADISKLNGMVNDQLFEAYVEELEKHILDAYKKFDNQEYIWQKAINDMQNSIESKATFDQLDFFRNDVNKHLQRLNGEVNVLHDILGEPKAATITRKIHRDAACLSCSTPAYMAIEEPGLVPKLPAVRPPVIGAEEKPLKRDQAPCKPKGDGDRASYYPGQKPPHSIDQRSHICSRYCGGSHTKMTNVSRRAPVDINIKQFNRETYTGTGSDGRAYRLDTAKEPGVSCNIHDLSKSEWILTKGPMKAEEAEGSDQVTFTPEATTPKTSKAQTSPCRCDVISLQPSETVARVAAENEIDEVENQDTLENNASTLAMFEEARSY